MNINEMILDFINSRDIAEHLKKLNYEFSTPEASYLIYRSHKHTLDKKIDAWNTIIAEMPDCSMAERVNMEAIQSMHRFIKEYINVQKNKLEYFYKNDGAVYFHAIHYEGDPKPDYSQPFSTFEKCMQAVKDDLEYMREYKVVEIFIKKHPLDNSGKQELKNVCEVEYNDKLEIMRVVQYYLPKQYEDIDEAFEGMWFQIPTPFKKGDIVIEPTKSAYTLDYNVPLVLDSVICNDDFSSEKPKDAEWRKNLIKRLKKNGDTSDMTYNGYWLNESGIYEECGHDYLSLEYYRQPLTDENRFLKALSMYLKDECSLDFLIDAKDVIFGEKRIKARKRYLNQLDEIIKSVGIEK